MEAFRQESWARGGFVRDDFLSHMAQKLYEAKISTVHLCGLDILDCKAEWSAEAGTRS